MGTLTENRAGGFSLYANDVARLVKFIDDARQYAQCNNDQFNGISVDVDKNGFVTVFAAGLAHLSL
jgi:hypothetical protein